ncbi:glycosyltransferase [Arthrobacter sp. Leaf337]|uniref:glycosyltransferase n=1 Tax=Arthrobacter sp. Leaf337 TaxID=1736342 RepID=UPI00138F7188|nr:glycosyltransferase [Arthrobacter sp. Leaf337]
MHTSISRPFNKRKIHRLFRHWITAEGPKILWTYTPVTYGLEEYADSTVYHCVDLLGEFPGVSASMIRNQEARLAPHTATAIGSSQVVEQHLIDTGFKNVLHWPNVADVETILNERPTESARDPKRVVFAGNLSRAKVDFKLLRDIVEAGFELHLAGPIAEGGGDATPEVEDLRERGAVYHGLLSLEELSRLYWTCSVGLIPYKLTSYTRGVNPLKTFEYLAAGLGVVSTAVPAVQAVPGHVVVVEDAIDSAAAIEAILSVTNSDAVDSRMEISKMNSWLGRGESARQLVADTFADIDTPGSL